MKGYKKLMDFAALVEKAVLAANDDPDPYTDSRKRVFT